MFAIPVLIATFRFSSLIESWKPTCMSHRIKVVAWRSSLCLFLSSTWRPWQPSICKSHVHFLSPRSRQSGTTRVQIAHICQTPRVIMQCFIIGVCKSAIAECRRKVYQRDLVLITNWHHQDHEVFLQRRAGAGAVTGRKTQLTVSRTGLTGVRKSRWTSKQESRSMVHGHANAHPVSLQSDI